MANLTKDNPARIERDLTIVNDRLSGMVYREIAKKHGITKGRINQILNDDQIKDILETGTKEITCLVPKAIDNYQTLLQSKDEKIKLAASKDVLKTTRIMDTRTGDNYFTNIFNQTNITALEPEVLDVLHKLRCKPVEAQVVEE